MNSAQSLHDQVLEGGLLDTQPKSKSALFSAAANAGITVLEVDCDRARSRSAVLRAIAKAVDFPEFFGSNLEALYDCLTDTIMDQEKGLLLWFSKLHTGDSNLAPDAQAVLDVCTEAVEFAVNNEKVFTFVVEHAGQHSS